MNDKRTGFGVPEIKLGLLPGAGGTQRLVQKLSLPDALDLVLTGKEVKVKKAKSLGLVDDVVEPLGPGSQPTEERNIDYLRSIAVQRVKYVNIFDCFSTIRMIKHLIHLSKTCCSCTILIILLYSFSTFRQLIVKKPTKKEPGLLESKTYLETYSVSIYCLYVCYRYQI